MELDSSPVCGRVRDHEYDTFHVPIPPLQRDSTVERLDVEEPGLGFERDLASG